MLCLSVSAGVVSGVPAGPDGCPVDSYIALSSSEFEHYMVSPFKLSMGDASLVSSAVLVVWAVGFGFRMLLRTLADSSPAGGSSAD